MCIQRTQALKMGLYGSKKARAAIDSTFIHAYSRRKKKAGVSDKGARVGKVERTTYALGWRAHTIATHERLPLTYAIRPDNVNDKAVAPKLLNQALEFRKLVAIRTLIADAQYYCADFKLLAKRWIKVVIPAPPQVKEPMINLRVRRGFVVEGGKMLLKLYRKRMIVEQVFRAGKKQLNLDNLRWRGAAKVRMHVALCCSAVAITTNKMGKPMIAHRIKAFQ